MVMIPLQEPVKLFGIKEGVSMWLSWNFVEPFKQFLWLNVTHKSWCTHHGWYCNKNCTAEKLLTKTDIEANWAKFREDMKKIEIGPDGMCVYCGEFKGIVEIDNPNTGVGRWAVCETCKKIIEQQHKLSIGVLMDEAAPSSKVGERVAAEAQAELDKIAFESGTEIFSANLRRNKEGDK
jgi:hypothetical protein